MLVGELLLVALQSVRANLLRSMLTMLGIIIGVASVITMLAVGAGARGAVDKQIEALGAGLLSIRAGQVFQMGVAKSSEKLDVDDVTALLRDSTTIGAVVPEHSGMEQIKLGNQNRNLRIIGTTANFAVVQDYVVEYGGMFDAADDVAKRAVAVLGAKVPPMFDETGESIVGKTIYVRGLAFRVVGVLKEKGTTGFRNVDEQLWLPLNTGRYRLFGTDTLDLISAKPMRGVSMQQAIVDIERPARMKLRRLFDAGGALDDARDVVVASTNASLFAYVADGSRGLAVLQLTSPASQPRFYGFSPEPRPELIARYATPAPALALSKGLDRDRAVDESGNQIAVFGRLGSRPLNLQEARRLYLDSNGKPWFVKPQ